VTGSNGVNATVGNPTAPTQLGSAPKVPARATTSATVNGLRVHSSPSADAPVITSVAQGQKLQVIARKNGWIEVRMPDGTIGWVSSAYTTVKRKAGSASAAATTAGATGTAAAKNTAVKPVSVKAGATTAVAVNVRTGPSLNASIITTLPSGGSYQVIGRSNGWLHVQLGNGVTGWINAAAAGSTAASTATRHSTSKPRSNTGTAAAKSYAGTSVVTAGVRVHSAPGVNAPVVGMVAAGTHVTVLGYKNGWALVRLPGGQTGYVLGTYVR
jgi:N-acetylmuramoyl-L-alanine amidase